MQLLTLLASFLVLAKAAPFSQPATSSPVLRKRFIDVAEEDDDDDDYDYTAILAVGETASPDIAEVLAQLKLDPDGAKVYTIYNNSAFTGFSISASRLTRDQMRAMDSIDVMERHFNVTSAFVQRANAPWGLERVSSGASTGAPTTLSSTYIYDDTKLGQGADIYIVDTGINAQHSDFGGRAKVGSDTAGSGAGLGRNEGNGKVADGVDHDGHGTHVAGIAAGSTYGVAPNANIWGVKALGDDGSGNSADVLEGLDYVVNQHDAKKNQPGFVGSVASMSLSTPAGTSGSQTFNSALQQVVAAGVHIVVAAGNTGSDACTVSPAGMGGSNSAVITVGSIGFTGVRSTFSNSGPCVDLYAPGEGIVSDWYSSNTATKALSGTSMATPFVTGLVGYLMAQNSTLAQNPVAMKQWLKDNALHGLVTDGSKAPVTGDLRLLANNGVKVGPGATKARARIAAQAAAAAASA